VRLLSSEAILLDVVDLQERDRIVTFLTPQWGAKRGVARGARGKYSQFAGRLQLLARVRVAWFERDDRELVRIREVSLERPADALQRDLERLLVGSYLAEHAGLLAPENEPAAPLFRLLEASVSALLEGGDPALAARYFEVWALRLAGVFPSSQSCARCGRPWHEGGALLVEDELVCRDCAAGGERGPSGALAAGAAPVMLGPSALRLLAEIGRASPQQIQSTREQRVEAEAIRQLERANATLRRRFLGEELRSYRVMQRTLAE
jgi:DNA repair protein RecO (recombination protein O)